jgi:hypothetical protein
MKKPQLVLLTVADGSVALFVNGEVVAQFETKGDPDPAAIGEALAAALGVPLESRNIATPEAEDWTWSEAYSVQNAPDDQKDVVDVAHWDSESYPRSPTHQVAITDQRNLGGQLFVDVTEINGDDDAMLSVTVEVNNLPADQKPRPCVHLHFNGDALAASFLKDGQSIVIRPESDVKIVRRTLASGEPAFALERF